ncbi:MAG: DUF3999 family protein [Bacteroidota bacterium]
MPIRSSLARTKLALVSLLLAPLLPLQMAGAQPLAPTAFAQGLRIDSTEGAPVVAVELPVEVYQTIREADLRDLAVFNGTGEPVTHSFYQPPQAHATDRRRLPLFPLLGSVEQATARHRVRVQASGAEPLLQVDVLPPPSEAATRPLRGYLLDATQLDGRVDQIHLDWPDEAEDVVSTVTLETSATLDRWQPWGAPATVTHLRYGGDVLRQATIDLPPRQARYVRLRWSGQAPPPLTGVEARVQRTAPEATQQYTFEAEAQPDGAYLFDLGRALPLRQLQVLVPQTGTLVQGTLATGPTPEGPWRTQYRGAVYRVQADGTELMAPVLTSMQGSERYWRLVVGQEGGGVGAGPVRLDATWASEYVLFLTRGEGPFTVAYGSREARGDPVEPSFMLNLGARDDADPLAGLQVARTAVPVELGGAAQVAPGWAERMGAQGRYLLWGVLGLGTAMLLLLALRLLRRVDADSA